MVIWNQSKSSNDQRKPPSLLKPFLDVIKNHKAGLAVNKGNPTWNNAVTKIVADLEVSIDKVERNIELKIKKSKGIITNQFWKGFAGGLFWGILTGIVMVKVFVYIFNFTITG